MKSEENPAVRDSGVVHYSDVQNGLLRVGFVTAVCFFIASHVEHVFIAAVMHSLLLLGASASAISGALRVEHPTAPVFTRWDEALILVLFSLVMFRLVDPEAVQNALIAFEHARSN